MKRLEAIKSAERVWRRSIEELPERGDDAALLALIERTQAGDEVANAGLMLVMASSVERECRRFSWGTEAEAVAANGQGNVYSLLWFAVMAFDTTAHRTKVSARLTADVRYLARLPTRLAYRRVEASAPIDEFIWVEAPDDTEAECVAFDHALAVEWLETVMADHDVPEIRQTLARELFENPCPDRELADRLGIPFGSISRHRNGLRRVLGDRRNELVA